MNEEYYVCRTCLMRFSENEIPLNSMDNLKLQIETCLPELTLNFVKNFIICQECTDALFFVYNFKKMCLETEEKIYNYALYSRCQETSSFDIRSVVQWYSTHKFQTVNGKMRIIPINTSTESELVNIGDNSINNQKLDCSSKSPGMCIKKEEFIQNLKYEIDEFDGDIENDTDQNEMQSNYEKFCEFENQFANYSINEFYEKGLIKLPECSVLLERVSDSVIKKYASKPKKCVPCKKCKLVFLSKTLKIKHDEQFHRKPINCSSCNYKTKSKALLYLHLKAHSNLSQPKMYKCTKCRYFSLYEADVFYHLRQHSFKDSSDKEKTHKCEICDFSNVDLTRLLEHLKEHNTLQCIECSFETWFRERLEMHLQVHYVQSPYECKLCKANFTHQFQLINHIVTHLHTHKLIQYEHNYCVI